MVDSINGINALIGQAGSSAASVPPYARGEAPQFAEPRDRVTISEQARKKRDKNTTGIKDEKDLSAEEKQQVNDLKKRDAEVKAHEQAHMAAGGSIVQGGASYEYEHGPDGKMYAVGGEVQIDVSPERTPQATIRKMQQVQRAALAPAQPSGTDRAVAARAAQVEAQARAQDSEESPNTSGTPGEISTETGDSKAVAPTDAGASSSDPNFFLSYKADLSPSPNLTGRNMGSKIDLSA